MNLILMKLMILTNLNLVVLMKQNVLFLIIVMNSMNMAVLIILIFDSFCHTVIV